MQVPFNQPPFVGPEIDYVRKAVESGRICGDGQFNQKCHAWLEKRTGVARALLTTSCTHALEMSALLCGIQPGDEVIMPSFTFVSTADAFAMRGAKCVFVDIRPDTMNSTRS
jgi:Predicted pyridoxal phosphate-dependent enzyme apparently involved in regulation of cell wall biogenesis